MPRKETREVWVTDSGREFLTEQDALKHEVVVGINAAMSNDNTWVDSNEDAAEWIVDNATLVREHLAKLEN